MPRELIDRAEKAFDRIDRSNEEDVVLHGDLHHENILLDERSGWLAIDPKGAIGARILEVGRFLQNQLPFSLPLAERARMLRERIRILSEELRETPGRLAAAGLVDCVLSHCWGLEDESTNPEWALGLEHARVLLEMAE